MNSSLFLLIFLQLRGWLRFLGRSIRTVRGAITALLGGCTFGLWLVTCLVPSREASRIDPDALRRNGPAFLLLYCLANVLVSSGERAIYFSPGEVNFLFGGPFGRREILAYKVVSTFLVSLPSTLILAMIVRIHAGWFWAAYVALLLFIMFQQLFGMAVNLLATSLGVSARTRGRQFVLAVTAILTAIVFVQAIRMAGYSDIRALLQSMTTTPTWEVISTPLRWFFDAFLSEQLWPDLLVNAAKAALVDFALLGVVFALDADYLEAAATSSSRIYARIQRLRRGGLAAAGGEGKVRFGLPDLPYWGGAGPVLWRQLTTAARGPGRLILALGLVTVIFASSFPKTVSENNPNAGGIVLGGIIVWLTIFLTPLVPFDFRGDVDRIATLKSLPLASWRISIGQLLAPVIIVTTAQWIVLATALAMAPADAKLLLVIAAYLLPFNFLLFGLENLLFLHFPTRLMAATPGDFQAVGRNLLFMLAKMTTLTVVVVMALLFGYVTYQILCTLPRIVAVVGRSGLKEMLELIAPFAGVAAGWVVLALSGAMLVPLVAMAFNAFDVGRDTPP